MAKVRTPDPKFAVSEMAVAAFTAKRIVDALPKQETALQTTPTIKSIIIDVLDGRVLPTQKDCDLAAIAVETVKMNHSYALLKGANVGNFQRALVEFLEGETGTKRDAGMLAYLPSTYENMIKRQERDETVAELSCSSEYLGKPGDKVAFTLTLLDSRYLEQYGCYSVTGYDEHKNLVSYLTSKADCTSSGKYTGKVKSVGESKYHNGAKVTNLNFVKAK